MNKFHSVCEQMDFPNMFILFPKLRNSMPIVRAVNRPSSSPFISASALFNSHSSSLKTPDQHHVIGTLKVNTISIQHNYHDKNNPPTPKAPKDLSDVSREELDMAFHTILFDKSNPTPSDEREEPNGSHHSATPETESNPPSTTESRLGFEQAIARDLFDE
ncbi:hypothetical protein BDF14DRAFT_1742886 [Spinellus fusiger]|nr:hypothetical protein BDF14DRAFT_1742886 [Spinellus fusiger]